MVKASKYLKQEDLRSIEEAIARAERRTSGEVVVVLATRSGRYDRGEDIFGVACACAAVAAGWFVLESFHARSGTWAEFTLGLLPVLGLFVGGFIAGAMTATLVPHIGLLFTGSGMIDAEIKARAAQAFHRFRIRRTAGGHGVLIYVSLLEHRVWVVGDDAVDGQVDARAWAEVRDRIVRGFKAGAPAAGLLEAVERVGGLLAEKFPVQEGDVNELTNEVRFID